MKFFTYSSKLFRKNPFNLNLNNKLKYLLSKKDMHNILDNKDTNDTTPIKEIEENNGKINSK